MSARPSVSVPVVRPLEFSSHLAAAFLCLGGRTAGRPWERDAHGGGGNSIFVLKDLASSPPSFTVRAGGGSNAVPVVISFLWLLYVGQYLSRFFMQIKQEETSQFLLTTASATGGLFPPTRRCSPSCRRLPTALELAAKRHIAAERSVALRQISHSSTPADGLSEASSSLFLRLLRWWRAI